MVCTGGRVTFLPNDPISEADFFSMTNISKRFGNRPEILIENWVRSRNTIELLGLWETLYNENYNHIEFECRCQS